MNEWLNISIGIIMILIGWEILKYDIRYLLGDSKKESQREIIGEKTKGKFER